MPDRSFVPLLLVGILLLAPLAQGGLEDPASSDVGAAYVNGVRTDSHYEVRDASRPELSSGERLDMGPCDDCVMGVELPFAFDFYGVPYTEACLSSNGLILFGMCSSSRFHSTRELAHLRGMAVAWDDLYLSAACPADGWYETASPTSVTFRFSGQHYMGRNGPCGTVNFEARFFATGHIEFHYGTYLEGSLATATVGISRASGSESTTRWVLEHEPMNKRWSVHFLYLAPITRATVTGATAASDWYVGPVDVTLTASAITGPTTTYVSVDGEEFREYDGPVTLSSDGVHTVRYYSVTGIFEEIPKSVEVKIDATPPVTAIRTTPGLYVDGALVAEGTPGHIVHLGQRLRLKGEATDPASGIVRTFWRLNGAYAREGYDYVHDSTYQVRGDHVEFLVVDAAGHGASSRMIIVGADRTV